MWSGEERLKGGCSCGLPRGRKYSNFPTAVEPWRRGRCRHRWPRRRNRMQTVYLHMNRCTLKDVVGNQGETAQSPCIARQVADRRWRSCVECLSKKNFPFLACDICTRVHWESLQCNLCTFFRSVLKGREYIVPPELLLHFRWHKAQQPRWFLACERALRIPENCKEVLTLKKIHYLFRRRLCRPIRKIKTSL